MLTNEEKINLRERALRLANELFSLPFPCLGSLRAEAEDIYRFLSKDLDDDPLRLDTTSPVWRHEGEMSPEEYWRLHSKMHGIDWSRPQLVEFNHFNGDKTILETNGVHSKELFEGRMIGEVVCTKYAKGGFKYHGEIPQGQPVEAKTACLNFLEAMKLIYEGVDVRRLSWIDDVPCFAEEDIIATDWQIVNS